MPEHLRAHTWSRKCPTCEGWGRLAYDDGELVHEEECTCVRKGYEIYPTPEVEEGDVPF